ncbi:MFS transporter [Plantactinospora soyae]|uniref:EmrB/QacA subfamily drug resistance transporter n=1 Tax=Plantactinospora soyae TaxID=1544732 RepID=A0A927M645_9ACTN|nr:MFS transporter [Plantactinospora soyae]MBE1487550.1 EmrB/QacA subfamily drug resistance transporter [Plantactinospora soyae]
MKPARVTATSASDGERDPRRWTALVVLCCASFMVILDSQIVIVGMPAMQSALALDPSAAQWILTANLLTFGGLLLLGGRSADLLGRRRIFMAGLIGFLVTSVISGFAWNAEVIITARAVHGVSSALMVPSALSILMRTFEEGAERNKAIAAWSAVGGIGATTAMLVGGWLTSNFGWESVFLVNVPVVLVLLLVSPMVLRESRDHGRRRTFDLAGALTSTAALVALVYAISEAPVVGWLSVQTTGLLALVVVLGVVFVGIEARSSAPLVPLRTLRMRTVATGNLLMVFVAMMVFSLSFLSSLYGQQVLGYSAIEYGLLGSIMPVMAIVGAYIGQAVVTRRGFRPAAVPGVVMLGVACAMLIMINVRGNYVGDLLFPFVIFGLGLGIAHTTASIVALTGVTESESGLASGLVHAAFQVGGGFGIAIVSTVAVSFSTGPDQPSELTNGFQAGFVACVVFAVVALACAVALPGRRTAVSVPDDEVRPAPVAGP